MATYYWVGGAGTWNSTSKTNWAISSGGTGGAGYPTILDDVIVDTASGTGTVTCSLSTSFCRDFTVTALQALTFSTGITCAGNFFLPSGGSVTVASLQTNFIAGSAKTITTNGKTINSNMTFNGTGGTWTLQSAISGIAGIVLTAGTLNTNGQSVSINTFSTSGTIPRSLILGASTVTTSGSSGWTISSATGFTLSAGTSTIASVATTATFTGAGLTYNNVSFGAGGAGASVSITGSNTFNNLSFAEPTSAGITPCTFDSNQIITGTLTASSPQIFRRVAFYSNIVGTSQTLTVNAWSASPANLDFRNIVITGAIGTLTGTSLGDCGGNSGITFTAAKTVYWNLTGSVNWSATGWATSSGGTPAVANFPLAQDTAIFDNTGAMGTVSIEAPWNIGTIDASLRTTGGSLSTSVTNPVFYGNITIGTGLTLPQNGSTWTFSKQGTQTLNTNGVAISTSVVINSGTGSLQLLSNVNLGAVTVPITLTSGALDLNNFGLTLSSTTSVFTITANALARSIAFGTTGSISIANSSSTTIWSAATLTNFTLSGTPTVNITGVTATGTRTVSHGSTAGGIEANAININVTAGSSTSIVALTGVFKNIDLTGFAANLSNTVRTIYGNFIVSTGVTLTAGTLATTFAGTGITQDFTTNGKTIDFLITIGGNGNTLRMLDAFTQGTARAFTINSGCTFNANSFSASVGILSFSSTPTITNLVSNTLTCDSVSQSGGTLTMSASFKLAVTGAYNIFTGTLDFGNQSVSFGALFSVTTNVRTINLGSGTITLTSTGTVWSVTAGNLTVNAGTSTINLTGAGAKTFIGAAFTYYNLVQASTAILSIGAGTTFNSISNTVQPTTILFPANGFVTVANLNLNGTAGNLVLIGASVATNPYTINYTGSTVNTLNYVSVTDFIGGTAGIFFATNSNNGGNNTNLTFAAADTTPRYWVGGTASWTNTATANWASSTGGAGGASSPTIETDVFFDVNSNVGTGSFVVTQSGSGAASTVCRDLTISGLDGSMTFSGSGAINVYGSWFYPATNLITTAQNAAITFKATTTGKTITSNGRTINGGSVTFDGIGGEWTLADAITVGSILYVTNGSFNTGGFAVTAGILSSNNSNIRSINLGASVITLGGTGQVFAIGTNTNLSFNAGTSQIIFTTNSGLNAGTGLTFYNISFTGTSTSVGRQILGNNTFNNVTIAKPTSAGMFDLYFTGNQVISGTLSFTGSSTPEQRIFLRSFTLGTPVTLTVNAVVGTDVDFRDINITGTAAPFTFARSGDCGGNSGITFPASKTVYWNLAGSQNFTATGWALTSGGTPLAVYFPLPQDTAVFNDAGSAGPVTFAVSMNYPGINSSARTSSMSFASSIDPAVYGSWVNGSGITSFPVNTITFSGRGSYVITSAGKSFGGSIIFDTFSGTYTLTDALNTSLLTITVTTGNFNSANFTITCGSLISSAVSGARSITLGTSTVNLGQTATVLNLSTTAQGLIFSGENCTINLTDTTTNARTATGGGQTLGTLNIGGTTGISTLTLGGTGTTWNNITSTKTVAHTILISASTVINFNNFNVSGTAGNLVTLTGSSGSTYNYIGAGVISVDYVSAGTASVAFSPAPNTSGTTPYRWYLGANSVNTSATPGTLGAAFISGSQRAYLITSTTTTWTVPTDWSNNHSTIHMIGAGGGGGTPASSGDNRAAGGGGGGGGYTRVTNAILTPGSTVGVAVGSSGASAKGGDTYFNAVYLAGGGQAGTAATTPTSAGGAGGVGSTFNGGAGGAGAFGTVALTGYGSGGGGGAGGPNGVGGAGGTGFGSTTTASISGGGGGGNGGGSAGGNAASATQGNGGNNSIGTGGGTFTAGSGTLGGGGAGGVQQAGGAGGSGIDILNTIGGAGGGGGTGATSPAANTGLYGGGSSGGGVSTTGSTGASVAGSQGMIFIVYNLDGVTLGSGVTIQGGITISY